MSSESERQPESPKKVAVAMKQEEAAAGRQEKERIVNRAGRSASLPFKVRQKSLTKQETLTEFAERSSSSHREGSPTAPSGASPGHHQSNSLQFTGSSMPNMTKWSEIRQKAMKEGGGLNSQNGEGSGKERIRFSRVSAENALADFDMPVTSSSREVYIGCKAPARSTRGMRFNAKFADNSVTTSRYNIINFLPKNLFEQLRRVANLYFLAQAILMVMAEQTGYFQTPYASYTVTMSLSAVIAMTMIKELFEDLKRHRSDKVTNRRKAMVLDRSNQTWAEKRWQHLCVGDIVEVTSGQEIPADLVLLSSSETDGGSIRGD